MNKVILILKELIFILAGLIIFWVFKNEMLTTISVLVILLIYFKIKYVKGEWALFFFGTVLGMVLEIGGDLVLKLQYWEQASFFGIPLWLPLLWGFAFVFMRRVGNIIVD